MRHVRHLLAQRHWAVLVFTAALLVKLLVPAGYMIDGGAGIRMCSGVAAAISDDAAAIQGSKPDHNMPRKQDKAEMPCAFSGLSAPMLGVVDLVVLAAALAVAAAMALWPVSGPARQRWAYLRPPLRGPPVRLS